MSKMAVPTATRLRQGARQGVEALRVHAERLSVDMAPALKPVRSRVAPVWGSISTLGRLLLLTALLAWLVGLRLGWVELFMLSAFCLTSLLLAAGFTVGRAPLRVHVDIERDRVFAGTRVGGDLVVTNMGNRRLLPFRVELPVGLGRAPFDVPSMAGGGQYDAPFLVPTARRSVIDIGPATSVRGDPLGLLRRTAAVADVHRLFVHPAIAPLGPMGAGLLRDLEGRTTRDLSHSDLAFHTLRDYVPGDDLRYVHWRSSAKAAGHSGSDTLLVRQFLDTRRSRLTIAVDGTVDSYGTEDDFEAAVSVAASLGVRALQEELDLTVVVADAAVTPRNPQHLLDTLAGASWGAPRTDMATVARAAAVQATDTSIVVLVTGNVISFSDLQGAGRWFGPDVSVLAVRIEPGAPAGFSRSGAMTVLSLPALADLPRMFAVGLAA